MNQKNLVLRPAFKGSFLQALPQKAPLINTYGKQKER